MTIALNSQEIKGNSNRGTEEEQQLEVENALQLNENPMDLQTEDLASQNTIEAANAREMFKTFKFAFNDVSASYHVNELLRTPYVNLMRMQYYYRVYYYMRSPQSFASTRFGE